MMIMLIVLFFVPFVKRVIYFPYLYYHEFGHSFMAFILRLRRDKMKFRVQDGSGEVSVYWNHRNKLFTLLVIGIGYIFPVLFVYGGIWSIQEGKTGLFFLLMVLTVVYGVFNTGSFIGWGILAFCGYVIGTLVYSGQMTSALSYGIVYYAVWIVGLGCAVTAYRLIVNYMYLPKEDNGDASTLNRELYLPVWFWTMIFLIANLMAIYKLYGFMSGKW